jgi:hypothetical protein
MELHYRRQWRSGSPNLNEFPIEPKKENGK